MEADTLITTQIHTLGIGIHFTGDNRMTGNNILLNKESETHTKTDELSYYLSLGRKSYENYIVQNKECDLDLAITSFEKVLELDDSNVEAMYRLASLLWEKGVIDIDTAISRCTTATELDPKSQDARLHLGYFFRAAGKLEEAIKEFRKAVSLNIFSSAKPRIALGVSLIQKAKANTAYSLKEIPAGLAHFGLGMVLLVKDIKSVHLILKSIKEDVIVLNYKAKGKVYEMMGLKVAAFNHYEKAAKKVTCKEIFFELMGDLQKERKNFLVAADYFRRAVSFKPTDINLYRKLISVLDEEIDTKEIINYIKILCEFEPTNGSLQYDLGHLYLEDKNYFGAISSLRKAIELEPENPFYHNSLAYTLVQLDDYDGAINEYQKAININPENSWTSIVCQALGAIFYQAKRNADAAIMSYQMALSLDAENPEAFISLAEIYYDKKNYDASITCYQKALEFDQDNAQARCNLGFVNWEKGNTEEAINQYHMAIALYPEYDIAYNNLGVAYLDGENKPTLALKVFEMAIKHNPNYALAYYNKGRSLEELNRMSEAADYYQMALDLNTFTKEIDPEEIEKRLNNIFKVD